MKRNQNYHMSLSRAAEWDRLAWDERFRIGMVKIALSEKQLQEMSENDTEQLRTIEASR